MFKPPPCVHFLYRWSTFTRSSFWTPFYIYHAVASTAPPGWHPRGGQGIECLLLVIPSHGCHSLIVLPLEDHPAVGAHRRIRGGSRTGPPARATSHPRILGVRRTRHARLRPAQDLAGRAWDGGRGDLRRYATGGTQAGTHRIQSVNRRGVNRPVNSAITFSLHRLPSKVGASDNLGVAQVSTIRLVSRPGIQARYPRKLMPGSISVSLA